MKKTNNKSKLCAVYVRVSTEDQKSEGLSIGVQKNLCQKRAEEEGFDVLEIINDEGISGFKDDRPGLHRLKKLVEEGSLGAVVALESSRLFRNTESHISFMKLAFKYEVKILYVNQASPEDTATSKMTDTILANVNEFYRNLISDKVKEVAYARAEAGYFPAMPPLGYINAENPNPSADKLAKRIIIPDLIMGPLITELFQLYASGVHNTYDLTDWINERGAKSHRGYKLSSSVVYNILKNRIYLGEVKWGKIHNKQGKHKPLINQAIFNRVQALLEEKNHKGCRRRKHQWLLGGFIYCPTHGKRYVAEWHHKQTGNKTSKAYYHCSNRLGCGSYVEATKLETMVEDKFQNLQFSEEFVNLVIDKTKKLFSEKRKTYEGRKSGLISKRTALEGKRKVAEDKLFEGVFQNDEFTRIRTELDNDLRVINNELDTLEEQKGLDVDIAHEVLSLTKNIHSAYKRASFNLKRQYLSLFWEKFEVKDGVILKSYLSPLFDELLKAEEVFFEDANSEKPEEISSFSTGILVDSLLRDQGSNLGHPP
ncbi:MAG: recombinase family protein [Minisyncoccota bacterium]